MSDKSINSQWIDSVSCATRCIRNFKAETQSIDSCYIKYSLLEPFFESNISDNDLHLGIRKSTNSDDTYRYTSVFFFNSDFLTMIKNAEEIEVTFNLEYDLNNDYYIKDASNDDELFRNSIILKGHSFRNYYDLRTHWDDVAYTEFKTNYYCPFFCSVYEELKDALSNKKDSFTFTLNNSLLREFEKYGVKGLHLFCHNGMEGHWKIKNSCGVKVTRYKAEYNNVSFSDNAVAFKNTRELKKSKIKRTKMIEQKNMLCGYDRQHVFYFFGDKFNNAINKAKQLQITFNITWYIPSENSDLNDISINSNFSKSLFKLVGHTFKSLDEVKELGSDKYAIFELGNTGADMNPALYSTNTSFDTSLKEGRTQYSFMLNEADLERFKNMYGFRIGKNVDTEAGQWIVSENCEVKILEYKDGENAFDYLIDGETDWILKNKPIIVGTNKKISTVEHAGFYFFDNLKEELNKDSIKSIRIRLHHSYNFFNADNAFKKHFYICGHNYKNITEVQDFDYKYKDNIIGILKVLEDNKPTYSDFYITDRETLELIKQYDGLCIYSMRNTSLTTHNDFISIFVNYDDGLIETKDRVFTYIPNGESDAIANTYLNDSYDVDDRFLCGNIKNNLFKPFLFFKSDLHSFLNSDIHIESIVIRIITGESVEKEVNGETYNSLMYLDQVELYTHDIVYDQIYCYCYQYKNKLCDVQLMTGQYTEVSTDTVLDKVHLINALKNCYGIGAYALNASESEFIYIKECQIIVTYTE